MSTTIFSADSDSGAPIAPSGASRLPKDLRRQQLAMAERTVFRLAWGGISIIDEDWE